ncbi:MAG TPA: hypothetical protein VJY85_12100 [Candidatus Limnocylindria bacterium]|nr:hypothetical protein [Candidatus Limnocylindria bacterium]
MSGERTYLRAVGSAVAHGALAGAWTATGELPQAQRRALRLAATAMVVVSGWVASARDTTEYHYTVGEGLMVRHPDGTEERRPVRKASLAATALFGTGMIIGRRQLEKRWLARLERQGHTHPYRALALRIGMLATAGALGRRLIAMNEAPAAAGRSDPAVPKR